MQEIVNKIIEKLKPGKWYDQLRIFLHSSDFSDIIVELKKKVEVDKQRFCPSLGIAFRWLEELPFKKIKVVILIDYTSNLLEQNNGIPISCQDMFIDKTPVALLSSIDGSSQGHMALEWIKQGVLIMPLALTSRIDGASHKKLWAPFIIRIIEVINLKHPKIPWVLIGKDTFKYEDTITSPNTRCLELKSPLDDKDWFSWVNNVLSSQNKATITF